MIFGMDRSRNFPEVCTGTTDTRQRGDRGGAAALGNIRNLPSQQSKNHREPYLMRFLGIYENGREYIT